MCGREKGEWREEVAIYTVLAEAFCWGLAESRMVGAALEHLVGEPFPDWGTGRCAAVHTPPWLQP